MATSRRHGTLRPVSGLDLPPTRLADAMADGPRAIGRSHRLHRPRGGFCARGYCQQCPSADNEGLACELPADGVRPRTGRDLVRPLGWIGESMEPWFYERRFLRPRAGRQAVLEVLRRLSAAHTLGTRTTWPSHEARTITTDVIVIGGGPCGIAAAAAVGATGVRTVVATLGPVGGSQPRSVSAARRTASDVATARTASVEILERSLCVGFYEEGALFAFATDQGPASIHAERVVVATGAYDRSLVLPGVDLPGVIGARAFERLAAQGAFSARHRIGAFAGPSEAVRIDAAARAAGRTLGWSVSPPGAPETAGATHAGRTISRIEGRRSVRRVVLDDGTSLAADVVVLGFTQPTYEIQVHLGQTPSIGGVPPIVSTNGPSALPVLVVGEAAGDVDPAGSAERAADQARAWIHGEDPARTQTSGTALRVNAVLAPDATVCVCEDVSVAAIDVAIADGFGDVELLKRRSGACTGACQGKLCLGAVGEVLMARGLPATLPTIRPPIRPVPIAAMRDEAR